MKIAIHKTETGFDDRWIEYCKNNNIDYKIVNCYANDIIVQIADCDALMWHFHQASPKDVKFAKQLLASIEISGKSVFPNINSAGHFDDKVGQKYLLESIGAPLVRSYAFYDKSQALKWADDTTFPKVFKLRGGAGSSNVRLAKTKADAKRLIRQAFGRGFSQFPSISLLKERWHHYKNGHKNFAYVLGGIYRLFRKPPFAQMVGNEKGYVYFQDFIPQNKFDIRIIVIDDNAFAIKRLVRPNDFRASGSGNIIYDKDQMDERCVKIAISTSRRLKAQSMTYDFIFDTDNNPLIVEISYGFVKDVYDACPGYWDGNLIWHNEPFDPYGWMINTLTKARE